MGAAWSAAAKKMRCTMDERRGVGFSVQLRGGEGGYNRVEASRRDTAMSGLLDGQIALVTGVINDGQIGQSVAQIFAYNGAGIGIAARSQKNVEARAKELEAEGAKALALPVDLADETQVGQAVERMIAHYGRIHILVNLAGGLTRYKAAVDHTLDDWNAELNNNLLTAFLCSRAVFPHMR